MSLESSVIKEHMQLQRQQLQQHNQVDQQQNDQIEQYQQFYNNDEQQHYDQGEQQHYDDHGEQQNAQMNMVCFTNPDDEGHPNDP